jgi:hypothetical protein
MAPRKTNPPAATAVSLAAPQAADWQPDAQGTLSGDWSQIAHWSTGTVPGTADAVTITDNGTATAAWIVTETSQGAASLLLDMTLGTFEATAGLSCAGTLTETLGTLLLAPSTTASVGALEIGAGQSGGTPVSAGATLGGGGGAATLAIGGALALGAETAAGVAEGTGTLAIEHGSVVTTGTETQFQFGELDLFAGSVVTLDAASFLDVGSVTSATAGAVNVGGNARLTVDTATIGANLINDGVVSFQGGGNGAGPAGRALLTGSLVNRGMVQVGSSTLTVPGGLELEPGSGLSLFFGSGSTVNVGTAGVPGVALLQGATLDLFDTTLNSSGVLDALDASATLRGGAAWTTKALAVGLNLGSEGVLTAALSLNDSTVTAASSVDLGYDAAPRGSFFADGTLTLQQSSTVSTGTLAMNDRSVLTVSPTSSVVLGSAAPVAGAVAIGADGTFTSDQGSVSANLIDDGSLVAHDVFVTGSDLLAGRLNVDGTVSGTGTIALEGYETLEVADAAQFAGGLLFSPGPLLPGPSGTILQLDAGDLPHATLEGNPFLPFTIDLRGLPFDAAAMSLRAGSAPAQLVVADASASATLGVIGTFESIANFSLSDDGHGGTWVIDTPCYAAGTRIATAAGAVPVEALGVGDLLLTADGRRVPVRWIARRRIDLARHPRPWRAAPVRIAAHAIAPGMPARDLFVSPDHGIFLDGRLVPAARLANGATIARQDDWPAVTYLHVELDRHEIILAEDCPAESYLDTGNRFLFGNVPGPRPLHPDLADAPDPAALAVWAARGAAPLLLEGEPLERLRRNLLARAEALGWVRTAPARPKLLVDGRPTPLTRDAQGVWRARLRRGTRVASLCSASFIPAEVSRGSGDPRRLGLAVQDVRLDGAPLLPSARARGWHAAEIGFVWTNGAAELWLTPRPAPALLELWIAETGGPYWTAPRDQGADQAGLTHGAGRRG